MYLRLLFLIMTGFYKPVAITLPALFLATGCVTVSHIYRNSSKVILERVLKQEILTAELLSDFEKLKRFALIFVYGMYLLMYVLIFYF